MSPRPTVESCRVCVISAAHLTETTWDRLMLGRQDEWPLLGGKLGPDMLIVWAPTDPGAHDLPPDLRAVVAWARAQTPPGATPTDPGWEYVIVDRDADPDDGSGLPTYART